MKVCILVVRSQLRCVGVHVVVGLRMFMVVGRDGDSSQERSNNSDMMASPG